MKREFARLRQGPFDVLVIGGGIYGAWIAYDSALRGMRVALVERKDWGAGTSSASSKLIHGGLRYLEQGRVRLVRRTLQERGRLMALASHRVQPVRFLMPLYEGGRAGRLRLGAGLWLYDFLAGRSGTIERHAFLDPARVLQRCPFLERDGLTGGFTFADAQMDDARFVLELVDGALEAGVVAVNGAEVVELLKRSGRVEGAVVKDRESDSTVEVMARVVVSCAGPWSRDIVRLARPAAEAVARLTKGVHLVLPALPGETAVIFQSRHENRVLFLIPWYGRTLLGTTDTDYHLPPDQVEAKPPDVESLLAEAASVLRTPGWREEDVISRFAGLRNLPVTREKIPSRVGRELLVEEPVPGLITLVGGKYSSARSDAADIVSNVAARLGRRGACPTIARSFPWAPPLPFGAWSAEVIRRGMAHGLDRETATACARRHGARVDRIHALLQEDPQLAARVSPGSPFCLAEVIHAVRHEMVLTLEDLVRRRLPLLLVDPPKEALLRQLADLAGPVLGWSHKRRHDETQEVLRLVQAGSSRLLRTA